MKLYVMNEPVGSENVEGFVCLAESKADAIKAALDHFYALKGIELNEHPKRAAYGSWIEENIEEYPVDQPMFVLIMGS